MDKGAKLDRRPIISLKRMASNVVRSNWNDDSDDSEWKEIVTQTLFDIEWSKMKVEDWWTREDEITDERLHEAKENIWTIISTKRKEFKVRVLPGQQRSFLRKKIHKVCSSLGLHTKSLEKPDGPAVFAWKPLGWKWEHGENKNPGPPPKTFYFNEDQVAPSPCDDQYGYYDSEEEELYHRYNKDYFAPIDYADDYDDDWDFMGVKKDHNWKLI